MGKKTLKFIPEASHGVPLKDCKPLVVKARVVETRTIQEQVDNISRGKSTFMSKTIVNLECDVKGKTYWVTETFKIGDVIPKLGQYVSGVLVCNQWGTYKFMTTHLLKVKE